MTHNGRDLRYDQFADFLEQHDGRILSKVELHDRLHLEIWLVGLVTVILEIYLSSEGETLGVTPFTPTCFKNDMQATFDALGKIFEQENDR